MTARPACSLSSSEEERAGERRPIERWDFPSPQPSPRAAGAGRGSEAHRGAKMRRAKGPGEFSDVLSRPLLY